MFLAHLSTTCSRGAFRWWCPSCVINNFFKHLLPNRWANLDQTWQECSMGGPLQKLFTEFDSIKNSGCHGSEMEFFKQFFKNLLWNHWSDFEIISQECSLGDPFQKLFAKFWSVHKYGSGEWVFFLHYMDMKKFLKNFFLQNRLSDFEIISLECSLGDPFQKFVCKILICL